VYHRQARRASTEGLWWSQGMPGDIYARARSEVRRVRALEISLFGATLARASLLRLSSVASLDKRMINYYTHAHSDE